MAIWVHVIVRQTDGAIVLLKFAPDNGQDYTLEVERVERDD